VGYVLIEVEEVQNLLKNFKDAIGNKGNQTWELVGLLEVVGYKESLMLQLVELPNIPRLVEGKQTFKSTKGISGVEEGVVKLVGRVGPTLIEANFKESY
jgi:hypothetical protein